MAKKEHSIVMPAPLLPPEDALHRIWSVLEKAGVRGAGDYTLMRYSGDGTQNELVVDHSGHTPEGLPVISEPDHLYNAGFFAMWIDAHELLLSFDRCGAIPRYGLVFMSNAVRRPGPNWLTEVMDGLVSTLGIDVALLEEAGEVRHEIQRRERAGEMLLSIVAERLMGTSKLGPPLLAVLRSEVVPPDAWEIARFAGLRVGTLPSGNAMFSRVHDG